MISGCAIMSQSPQISWLSLSTSLSYSAGFTLLKVYLQESTDSKCTNTHCSSHSKFLLGGKKQANKEKEWIPQPTHTDLSLEHCMFLQCSSIRERGRRKKKKIHNQIPTHGIFWLQAWFFSWQGCALSLFSFWPNDQVYESHY